MIAGIRSSSVWRFLLLEPVLHVTEAFVVAVKNRNMFLSTEEIKVLRTRSLEFHCPTLVPPSYGPDGKQSGAQVASV